MTSAREMFNLLNYKLLSETFDKLVYAHRHERCIIEFEKHFKRVRCYVIDELLCGDDIKQPVSVSLVEIEAINQQIKELGWNE